MRLVMLLFLAALVVTSGGASQADFPKVSFLETTTSAPPQCSRANLSLKEGETDAAMGGVRVTDYILTNKSSSACTLNGFPRVELLNRQGKIARRAVHKDLLMDDSSETRPELVTIDAGKTAWFRVAYNVGGAGYMGKPCASYRIRIVAPGTTGAFVLRSFQSCPRTDFEVSFVRAGSPQY